MSILSAFQRNILRKIYGTIKETGKCRIRYNKELYQLYRSSDVMTSIKISRLRWAEHVDRMTNYDILKRIMDCKPEGRRIWKT